MVLAGQFRRACARQLFERGNRERGVFGSSSGSAQNGDDARAILKAMSDSVSRRWRTPRPRTST
jgi:hypothetical protein